MNKKKTMQFVVKTALMDNSRIKEACQVLMEIGQPILAHYLEKYGNRKQQDSKQELYFLLKQHAQLMTIAEEEQYEALKELKRLIFERTKKTTRRINFIDTGACEYEPNKVVAIEFERTKDGEVGDITYHQYKYVGTPIPKVMPTMKTPTTAHLFTVCMMIKTKYYNGII